MFIHNILKTKHPVSSSDLSNPNKQVLERTNFKKSKDLNR